MNRLTMEQKSDRNPAFLGYTPAAAALRRHAPKIQTYIGDATSATVQSGIAILTLIWRSA